MKDRQKRAKARVAAANAYDRESVNLCIVAQGGTPCPWPPAELSYTGFIADAEERTAAGETQKQCERCKLWRWKDEQAACDAKIKRSK